MSALMLIKQADVNETEQQGSNINPYLIGGGIGALGTGAAAYGIAKGKMDDLNQQNSKLSEELKAQKDAVAKHQEMINSYRKELEEKGSPDPVIEEVKKEQAKPGFIKRTINATKALFNFKGKKV